MLNMFFRAVVLLGATLLLACSDDADPSENAARVALRSGEVFVNPVFPCPTERVVEPGTGYPHPVRQFPATSEPEQSVAHLKDFCVRMQERFATSGMSRDEAARVYDAIPTVLHIADEAYGMPSPDEKPPPPVDLQSRVMLRKVGEDQYELFYYTIGCGRNYSWYELVLTESGAQVREIESWSETFPC